MAQGAGAAFSNPQPEISNDVGGLGGPPGPAENNAPEEPQGMPAFNSDGRGDNKLGGEGMLLPGDNINSMPFGGSSMKKVHIVMVHNIDNPTCYYSDLSMVRHIIVRHIDGLTNRACGRSFVYTIHIGIGIDTPERIT